MTTTIHIHKLRRAADKAARARSELDSAIAQARKDGISLRSIGDATGISHEHVRRLTR